MSHLPKMFKFESSKIEACNCGYKGTPTAMKLHFKIKHGIKKGLGKANQSCQECGVVVPGGDKELLKHVKTSHKCGLRY